MPRDWSVSMKRAIFLSGGGARGAYQAGVLKGIGEILNTTTIPFQIVSAVSAGSINAAYLVNHADNFSEATHNLAALWSQLHCDKIFRVGNLSLLRSVMRNLMSMTVRWPKEGGQYLLDTSPLRLLLEEHLDFSRMNWHIQQGFLSAFEIAATCYDVPGTVSFVHATDQIEHWEKVRHSSCETQIGCEHIMASTAFPLFFPAVPVGPYHYGDGGLRHSNPLRAAVRLGADSILIIGTRKVKAEKTDAIIAESSEVTFAKVLGTMLNALFLDNLERDLNMILHINKKLTLIPDFKGKQELWKKIDALFLRPSEDLGLLAEGKEKVLPSLLRYLMSAFGSSTRSGDFLSFLLFESIYCRELVELGYKDVMTQRALIENFFEN